MKGPVVDPAKLPKVMEIISEANSLMTEKDCRKDEAAKKDLEELEHKLREITGNRKINIRDFWRYDEAVSLETAARGALMPPPEREDAADEQLREIILHILEHEEAEMDWWLEYLEVNTGLANLTDYIFYPDLIGLDRDASLEQIADKIIADRQFSSPILL